MSCLFSRVCMVHQCLNCPGKSNLIEFLHAQFDDFTNDEIQFQQWQSTDRTTIVNMFMSHTEFIEFTACKVDQLTSHSYIAKTQAKYLSLLKIRLPSIPATCIVLADFAENYSMVVQDAVQGWHWTKQQCTIHPLVMYFTNEQGEVTAKSFAFFSDDLEHDIGFVYKMQKVFCDHLHSNFAHISSTQYVSDGCAGQYKNYKNFLNLTYHKQDFGYHATWNFFATSHGKSPCDAIGGTIKRKLYSESLKRTLQDHIITPLQAFQFCQKSITAVQFFFISKHDLSPIRTMLKERYACGNTVPGTRSFHVFIPLDIGIISYKRTAEDENITGIHNFFQQNPKDSLSHHPKVQDYVAVQYDDHWWIGLVTESNESQTEIKVRFMSPHGPRKTFFWPVQDDICWVPQANIIRVLKPLATTSISG